MVDRPAIRQLAATAFANCLGPAPTARRKSARHILSDFRPLGPRRPRSKYLRHDNEPFINELESRGFAVAEQSFANSGTTHSLISSLNLGLSATGSTASLRVVARPGLPAYDAAGFGLRRFLDAQGYEFHFFGSWWDDTRVKRLAHEKLQWLAMPSPSRALLDQLASRPYFRRNSRVLRFSITG